MIGTEITLEPVQDLELLTKYSFKRKPLDYFSWSTKFGYRDSSSPSLLSICDAADDKLFNNILRNSRHLLHPLLPPERNQHYAIRDRPHKLQIPIRTSALNNNNFLIRMLFKDMSYSSQSSSAV